MKLIICNLIKVNLRYFEATILTIIILSSFTLAAEDPVHRSSRKNDVLKGRVFSCLLPVNIDRTESGALMTGNFLNTGTVFWLHLHSCFHIWNDFQNDWFGISFSSWRLFPIILECSWFHCRFWCFNWIHSRVSDLIWPELTLIHLLFGKQMF